MNYFSVTFELSGGFGYYEGERCAPFLAALERLEAEDIQQTFVWDSPAVPPDLGGDGSWHVDGLIRCEDYAAACRKVADEQDEHWMAAEYPGDCALFMIQILMSEP